MIWQNAVLCFFFENATSAVQLFYHLMKMYHVLSAVEDSNSKNKFKTFFEIWAISFINNPMRNIKYKNKK